MSKRNVSFNFGLADELAASAGTANGGSGHFGGSHGSSFTLGASGTSIAAKSRSSTSSQNYARRRRSSVMSGSLMVTATGLDVCELEVDDGDGEGGGDKAIDTIFAYLDPSNSGCVAVSDLNMVLESIGETDTNNTISSVLSQFYQDSSLMLTKDDLEHILFAKRQRTKMQNWALWTVLWILPSFYSASTRLPFICLAVEVTKARGGELWQVSVLLGAYQSCRAIANFIISLLGGNDPMRRLHIPMVLIGLVGWTLAGLPAWDQNVWALLALCGVGLSESIVNLQTTLIHETRAESVASIADPTLIQARIRSQYAAVAGGVLFFWLLGGWLYTNKGFQSVTFLGISCHVAQLAGTYFFRAFGLSESLRQQRKQGSKSSADLPSDGRVFLRSVTYRVKAMTILAQEAKDVFTGSSKIVPGLDEAAALAKDDDVLHSSLKRLYRAFFNEEEIKRSSEELQGIKGRARKRKQQRSTTTTTTTHMSTSEQAPLQPQSRRSRSSLRLSFSLTGSTNHSTTVPPKPSPRLGMMMEDHTSTDFDICESGTAIQSMFKSIKKVAPRGSAGMVDLSSPDQEAFEASTTVDCAKVAVTLMDVTGDGKVEEREFIDYLAPRVYREVFQSSGGSDGGGGKTVNIIWPYMKAVVFTQAIMALCIGTFLSTSLLMYTERFDITPAMVGLLLAIGEGLGAGLIVATSAQQAWANRHTQNKTNPDEDDDPPSIFQTITSRPLHVPFMLFLVGAASAGFTCPVFAGAIFCQMVMSMLNDQSVSFLNELIATSIPPKHFRKYQGLGQWLRRLGNVVTGVMGPYFFGINRNLPFLFFGSTVIVWGFVLWYLLYKQARKVMKDKEEKDGVWDWELSPTDALREPFEPFLETSRTPWHVLEQRYFAAHKEEIEEELAPTHAQALNLAVLDFRMRQMGATQRMLELRLKKELKKEQRARKALQARLHTLELGRTTTGGVGIRGHQQSMQPEIARAHNGLLGLANTYSQGVGVGVGGGDSDSDLIDLTRSKNGNSFLAPIHDNSYSSSSASSIASDDSSVPFQGKASHDGSDTDDGVREEYFDEPPTESTSGLDGDVNITFANAGGLPGNSDESDNNLREEYLDEPPTESTLGDVNITFASGGQWSNTNGSSNELREEYFDEPPTDTESTLGDVDITFANPVNKAFSGLEVDVDEAYRNSAEVDVDIAFGFGSSVDV